jgi:phytanoyl-CoA hydroxylase
MVRLLKIKISKLKPINMNSKVTQKEIDFYQENGYIIFENFLTPEDLEFWREAVDEAIKSRNGKKLPDRKKVGDEVDETFYNNVYVQMMNLWQDNDKVRKIMLDERLGEMVTKLADVDGIRIWHDQALIKKPWANPTSWHLDNPYWSFTSRDSISIWVALDDATRDNGCLYFIPGSHKLTTHKPGTVGQNMNTLFLQFPELSSMPSLAAPMKAGSCSFHNGLTAHAAHANNTNGLRRAMTCAYMPQGSVFNGTKNVLTETYFKQLKIGDELNNNDQNPLIYSRRK